MSQKIILTVGISNSGKTTWAEQFVKDNKGYVNLNRDDVRKQFSGNGNLNNYKFTKSKEKTISTIITNNALIAIEHGLNLIISDTNLNPSTRNYWEDFARENGLIFEYITFPIEPHIAKKRNQKREYSVPMSVIDKQYKQFREFVGLPTYKPNKLLPKAVIFDIDGTLADMKGVRTPFEWDKVDLDKPKENVVALLKTWYSVGCNIIIMSGRDGCCKHLTEKWLKDNQINYTMLLQRAEGDTRPDAVIKEELFFKHVADDYNVLLTVDDRNQMVDRWRAIGLECWQVQEGDF